MKYETTGENEVTVSQDDGTPVGVIRLHGGQWGQWEFGSMQRDGGVPEHWIVLIPGPIASTSGIVDAIEEARKFLG